MTKTKALKTTENNELSLNFTEEQKQLIMETVAKGASENEVKLLFHVAKKYKLDPLLKEIWCIKMLEKSPAVITTSRDGYLSIAHRSGQLDGLQSGTILNEQGQLIKAWCEVWRKDMSHSFKSEVNYGEYYKNNNVWNTYPSAMLIKVAEVFALKRAFSISGLVTEEEMGFTSIAESDESEAEENITEGEVVEPTPTEEVSANDEAINYLIGAKLDVDNAKTLEELTDLWVNKYVNLQSMEQFKEYVRLRKESLQNDLKKKE